jgi:hypothetical protein
MVGSSLHAGSISGLRRRRHIQLNRPLQKEKEEEEEAARSKLGEQGKFGVSGHDMAMTQRGRIKKREVNK